MKETKSNPIETKADEDRKEIGINKGNFESRFLIEKENSLKEIKERDESDYGLIEVKRHSEREDNHERIKYLLNAPDSKLFENTEKLSLRRERLNTHLKLLKQYTECNTAAEDIIFLISNEIRHVILDEIQKAKKANSKYYNGKSKLNNDISKFINIKKSKLKQFKDLSDKIEEKSTIPSLKSKKHFSTFDVKNKMANSKIQKMKYKFNLSSEKGSSLKKLEKVKPRNLHLSPDEKLQNILKEKELGIKARELSKKHSIKRIQKEKENTKKLKKSLEKELVNKKINDEIKIIEEKERIALRKLEIMKRFEESKRQRDQEKNLYQKLIIDNKTPSNFHKYQLKALSDKSKSQSKEINSDPNKNENNNEMEKRNVHRLNNLDISKLISDQLNTISSKSKSIRKNIKFALLKISEPNIIRKILKSKNKIKAEEEKSQLINNSSNSKSIYNSFERILLNDSEVSDKKFNQNEELRRIKKEKMKVYGDLIKEKFISKINSFNDGNQEKQEKLIEKIKSIKFPNLHLVYAKRSKINKTINSKISNLTYEDNQSLIEPDPNLLEIRAVIPNPKEEKEKEKVIKKSYFKIFSIFI